MIKLTKTYPAPGILLTDGVTETDRLIAEVDNSENTAMLELSFYSKIYANEVVKKQLMRDQLGKCAYCEQAANGDYGCRALSPKGWIHKFSIERSKTT